MRFHVLAAASKEMAAFRDVAPCSVVEVDRQCPDGLCPSNSTIVQGAIFQKAVIFIQFLSCCLVSAIYPTHVSDLDFITVAIN